MRCFPYLQLNFILNDEGFIAEHERFIQTWSDLKIIEETMKVKDSNCLLVNNTIVVRRYGMFPFSVKYLIPTV